MSPLILSIENFFILSYSLLFNPGKPGFLAIGLPFAPMHLRIYIHNLGINDLIVLPSFFPPVIFQKPSK